MVERRGAAEADERMGEQERRLRRGQRFRTGQHVGVSGRRQRHGCWHGCWLPAHPPTSMLLADPACRHWSYQESGGGRQVHLGLGELAS